jgi:hypothetical protein
VVANNSRQLKQAFEKIDAHEYLNIIRVKNKLDQHLQLVHINFTYRGRILGEIQLKIGTPPIMYAANHFLYELARADSIDQFRQQVLLKINDLA